MTDITGPDPLSLVELGEGSKSEKLEKMRHIVTYERVSDLNEILYLEGSCALELSF